MGVVGTECNWYGVTCSSGFVSEINMSDNALSGSILASLGNLTNLTTLVFASNSLSSSIPGQILIAAQLGLSAMIPVSSIA